MQNSSHLNKRGGLNGSSQHQLKVNVEESTKLTSFQGR